MVIIDGKHIANELIEMLGHERAALPQSLKLGVIVADGDMAAQSFVRIKERVADKLGVALVREFLTPEMDTEDALAAIERLKKTTQGIIVQLPLPKQFDTDVILAAVPTSHDADALHPTQRIVRAPVAEAVSEILVRHDISAQNKNAVVVGAGRLVGAPVAELLRSLGAHVSIVTLDGGSLSELKDADIVVSGAGSPGMIKPSMLKEGVVLIDAGTSEQAGRLVGDADPSCAEVASIFTPVPGGVGPIAVAMLFKNLFALLKTTE